MASRWRWAWLARCKRLRVYEQAPELREIGAGVSLSPNAVKGLRFLGVGERLEAMADEPPTQVTRHYATGKVLVNFRRHNTREQLGAPYLQPIAPICIIFCAKGWPRCSRMRWCWTRS